MCIATFFGIWAPVWRRYAIWIGVWLLTAYSSADGQTSAANHSINGAAKAGS
jgi:hypothetical protein